MEFQTGSLELVRLCEALTGWPLTEGNQIEALFNGERAFPAMIEAIRGTRHSCPLVELHLPQRPGRRGVRSPRALSEARQRNVEVRVLLDGGVADAFYRPRGSASLRRSELQPADTAPRCAQIRVRSEYGPKMRLDPRPQPWVQ